MPLIWAGTDKLVGKAIPCEGTLYQRLVQPLLLAALNVDPPEGSAGLAGAIVRETLLAGGQACRPLIARDGLSSVLIEPAIKLLQDKGDTVQLGHELREFVMNGNNVGELKFGDDAISLAPDDVVVLAVPPRPAASLLPGLKTPTKFRAIVNAHFRFDPPRDAPPILGVVGGLVEWLFAFPQRLSVTISNGDRLVDMPREELAQAIWRDVCKAGGVQGELPPWQIVRERRATFEATPEQNALRPGPVTAYKNLFLAGDWTDTGLPATIEGSVRSGDRAADLVLARHDGLTGRERDRLYGARSRTEGCLTKCLPSITALPSIPSRQSTVAAVDPVALEKSISSATQALLGYRQSDGHWVFELEADSTIPSEYVLLRHYLAEPVDSELEAKIANYLRRTQGAHGGWPLVQDGAFDMSASVKSYFALKMIGDSVDAPHMVRAREAIRSRGGAANVNVFTRFLLAFYGVLTWRAVPVLPIEIMLLPMWSPFHLNKISYWARTTIVPLMVLAALKPLAKNPKGVGIDELFLQDPKSVGMTAKAPHQSRGWFVLFRWRSTPSCASSNRCFRKSFAPARSTRRWPSSKSG